MHVWCCCQCLCSLTVRLSLCRPDFRSGLIILRPRSDRVSLFFFFMHIGLRYRFYTGPFVTKTHFPHSTAPQVFLLHQLFTEFIIRWHFEVFRLSANWDVLYNKASLRIGQRLPQWRSISVVCQCLSKPYKLHFAALLNPISLLMCVNMNYMMS